MTPNPDDRLLVVLDVDETLVYATKAPLDRRADAVVDPYHVYKRPHADAFVAELLGRYRVAVWTSATPAYAAAVVPLLFDDPDHLEFVWAADRCTRRLDRERLEHYPIKNLDKLKRRGYSLERTIVVDDTPRKHERNYGNLVRVSEYTGAAADDELLWLARYIRTLANCPNVRTVEKRGWLNQIKSNNPSP